MKGIASLLTNDNSDTYRKGACDKCRVLKIKCNRKKPCDKCTNKDKVCSYSGPQPKKRGPPPGTAPIHKIKSLSDRFVSSTLGIEEGENMNMNFSHNLEFWDVSKSKKDVNDIAFFRKKMTLGGLPGHEHILRQNSLSNTFSITPGYKIPSSINFISFQVLKTIINNSLIDNALSPYLYKNQTGDIEYLGNSPIIFLICNYVGIFYTKSYQDPKPPSGRKINKSRLRSGCTPSLGVKIPMINYQLISNLTQAFFKYYNPTFPLLDPIIFYSDYFFKCDILTNYVCAAGARYLYGPENPSIIIFFDNLAFNSFLTQKFTPSISICIVYLMMAQYLVKHSHFNRSAYYLGNAIAMAQMLGCHKVFKSSRLPPSVIEMRRRIWWACCILDKLYAFGLNRHLNLHKITSNIPPPGLPIINHENSMCETNIVRAGSELCFRHMYTLSFLMEEAVFLLKTKLDSNNIVDLDEKKKYTEELIRKLEDWQQVQSNELYPYTRYQPSEIYYIFKSFIYIPKLIYHSIVIQICLPYHDYKDLELRKKYQSRYTISSVEVILAAKNMGKQFINCGVTYRFYSLTSAILVQVFNYKNSDGHKEENTEFINIGLKILMDCSPIFPLAQECYNLVNVILNL